MTHNSLHLDGGFPHTSWTLVRAARDFREHDTAMREFSKLCRSYWYPLYGYARRRGLGPEDAADRTQDFFVALAGGALLEQADPAKGKLRTFFLTVFTHQLAKAREREQAQKRGGGVGWVELDRELAEGRLASEPAAPGLTPERWFDRQWALTVLETCLDRLGERMAADGNGSDFRIMRPFLSVSGIGGTSADDAARQLGVAPVAFRQRLRRLRAEFRRMLEEQVAGSLAAPTPEAVAEEIRCLQCALLPAP